MYLKYLSKTFPNKIYVYYPITHAGIDNKFRSIKMYDYSWLMCIVMTANT